MFFKRAIMRPEQDSFAQIERLKEERESADAIIIGAGAGLSSSAGFTYTGSRFRKYFQDFIEQYGFEDMYSGGFYPFETLEEHWAYWSRYIYINRYQNAPKPVYESLLKFVEGKEYFVITTNVDHCFQKAGFKKDRLFYTQGDYGLWQCSEPCHKSTYENKDIVFQMMEAQGFLWDPKEGFFLPEGVTPKMRIPKDLIPYCPICHKPMSMNLRADHTFVEDDGWHRAADRYQEFLRQHKKEKILFLEVGVGYNTPNIIKYNFWNMVYKWNKAVYACVNLDKGDVPREIKEKSICIQGDIGATLERMEHYIW